MAETAFVTGGSGFIGGRLVERLVAEGRSVRALARSEASSQRVAELGAEPVRGDIGDRASLSAAASGARDAFHLAAHLGEWGPWAEFERGNVDGTRNVLAACAEAGVRRFVHCGTEAALMAGEPLVHVDETAPLRPDSRAPYPATKARAEQAVRGANRSGFETVVVRPRFVWGKGDTTLLPEMVETMEAGKWAWVGGGRNVTDTAHVDNVVEGLLLARVAEAAWKVLPLRGAPPMTRFRSWLLTQECTIEIGKAREELGYVPIVSHEQGLAELREAA